MAQPHTRSGEVVALRPLGAALAQARTTALLKARQLEVVRLVLAAGRSLPQHAAPGEITLLGLEGQIELTTPSGRVEIGPGDFIHLAAREPHAVRAVRDASALLTICLLPG
jgi:quercetin dioxygenase-like cupin family protein